MPSGAHDSVLSRPLVRDGLFSFSFANLVMYEAYSRVLIYTTTDPYFVRHGAAFVEAAAAALLGMGLLAAAVFGMCWAIRKRGSPRQLWGLHLALLAVLALPALSIGKDVFEGLSLPTSQALTTTILLLAAIVVAGFAKLRAQFVALLVTSAIVLAPFGGIMAFQMAQAGIRYQDVGGDTFPQGFDHAGAATPSRRVVWLVLDELDEQVLTSDRPAGLSLPHFDPLRATSFAGTNASSPADHTTASIPSLLLGSPVLDARAGPGEAYTVTLSNRTMAPIDSLGSVFTDARARGLATAVVGWFHPYCRMLATQLDSCSWVEGSFSEPLLREMPDGIVAAYRQVLDPIPGTVARIVDPGYGRFSEKEIQQHEAKAYTELATQAVRAAADPRHGLVFVHMNVPHPAGGKGFYDPATKSLSDSFYSGYIDNLVLTDRFVGEVRSGLEAAGLWNTTTLIVTGDHGYRTSEWGHRIGWDGQTPILLSAPHPSRHTAFLVHIAGRDDGFAYAGGFDTVITRGLIGVILDGTVRTSADTADWIREQATR